MKPEPTRDKIMERIESGCYTAADILFDEDDEPIFELTLEDVQAYLHWLVAENRAEWRDQGRAPGAAGQATELCVPKDMPAGNNYHPNRPRGDENQP